MGKQIVALSPVDLAPAQASLLTWVDGRIAEWNHKQADAREAYAYAVKQKWAATRFRAMMKTADRKHGFYRKLRRALEAGYLIVPNFPVNIIAIRTNATKARADEGTYRKEFRQSAQILPEGEGQYRNPKPAVYQEERPGKDDKPERFFYPMELSEELEIPVRLQKCEVLAAVDRARALKLFDEIGVCADQSADPIVCGIVREGPTFAQRRVTFFLAWYVDLDDI